MAEAKHKMLENLFLVFTHEIRTLEAEDCLDVSSAEDLVHFGNSAGED